MDELDAIAARIQARDQGGTPGPWTLELYPTLRCNLDCAFCDTTDRHRPAVNELSVARQLAIVDEAAAMGVRRVAILGGGEPLLSAATPLLLERVKAHGMEGFLTTNGTRLDAVTDRLVALGWDEVHVSIDGAEAATHDALRGRPGAFRKSVSALCRLRRLRDQGTGGLPRLGLHMVLTNRNVDELAGVVRLAAALGCYRVDVDALVAYRPEQRALALGPAEEARLAARVEEAIAEADRLGVVTTLAAFRRADTLRRGARAPAVVTGAAVPAGPSPVAEGLAAAPCLKAWHYLVVQSDGRTSPCCVLAGTGGSVADAPVATVWEADPTLLDIRAGMRAGRPTGRCVECSENILTHERAIRARLPRVAPSPSA
ncbi:MAG: radical SAM protein [Pseudomonadota bacterium]|nr:radical SAM protein [Pseudomonadota bacterium]